jgi:hypothetical protein
MLKNLRTAVSETGQGTDPEADTAADEARSWAVQHNPSELEKILWRARKVNIYNMDMSVFAKEMTDWHERHCGPVIVHSGPSGGG